MIHAFGDDVGISAGGHMQCVPVYMGLAYYHDHEHNTIYQSYEAINSFRYHLNKLKFFRNVIGYPLRPV